MKRGDLIIAGMLLLAIAAAYSALPSVAKFSGSHSVYKIKNSSTRGDLEFCAKCHGSVAKEIVSEHKYKAHGSFTTCICHGYYPNYTNTGGVNITINLEHNLTKNIYCTNCHTNWSLKTKNISIGHGRSGLNQSGHYIYFNRSDYNSKFEVYNRAKYYLEQNFYL